MPSTGIDGPKISGPAPWYQVSRRPVVSVEHPCIVKNVDRGIEMLGGSSAITQILEKDTDKPISLRFHPDDTASRPIVSTNAQTSNLLLKITVPKRTGRKRKRGSAEGFAQGADREFIHKDVRYLLQCLEDNSDNYDIDLVGSIPSTHVWRSMPDFTFSTSNSSFLDEFRQKIVPLQYPLLKSWHFERAYGLDNTEVIPPPVLSTHSHSSNYGYRQNPAVKQVIDPKTGVKTLHNTQAPVKINTWQMFWDSNEYPSSPPASCIPLDKQPHNLRGLVCILTQIFERRPIWTRRALANQLPSNAPFFLARYAISYVAYAIRSGPWRDTYVKLGVDPRTDAKYRHYQTLLLQLVPSQQERKSQRDAEYTRSWARSNDQRSHIFTGRGKVPPDGKSWQVCDFEDHLLKAIVDIPDLLVRAKCEDRYFGWFPNGVWSKVKVVIKTKVDALLDGYEVDDSRFERFLKLPDDWFGVGDNAKDDPMVAFLPKDASKSELEWASAFRAMCRAPPGQVPSSGRLSKSKAATRKSFREHGDKHDGNQGASGQDQTEEEQREEEALARYADPDEDDGGDPELDFEEDGQLEMENGMIVDTGPDTGGDGLGNSDT